MPDFSEDQRQALGPLTEYYRVLREKLQKTQESDRDPLSVKKIDAVWKLRQDEGLLWDLGKATTLDKFNKVYGTSAFIPELSYHQGRFSSEKALTKTERLLQDARNEMNRQDNKPVKPDMYVDVLHRLHLRMKVMTTPVDSADTTTDRSSVVSVSNPTANMKYFALTGLLQKIKKNSDKTNPMFFYTIIVLWEDENNKGNRTNRDILADKPGFGLWPGRPSASLRMIDELKRDLLKQAVKNEQITVPESELIITSMRSEVLSDKKATIQSINTNLRDFIDAYEQQHCTSTNYY